VFNILIKAKPISQFDYEFILYTIIQWLSDKIEYKFKNLDEVKSNIIDYSFALQCLSNYLKNYESREKIGKIDSSLLTPTMNLRNFLCVLIAKVQNSDGSWTSNSKISNQLSTSHAINGLRSAGVSRSYQGIVLGCNWILNKLMYLDGKWCWTKHGKKDGQIKASISESCTCIAALLRGYNFKSFSRAEAAILWLLNEVSVKSKINNKNFPNILCAFSYYLRALSAPGFYK
jgi:hypothetical protein